jgi:GNAT superfamily N-acetyltransferase
VDDEDFRRIGWRGMAAFQLLVGRHAPGPAPLEHPDFVASAVPNVDASLLNAAVPVDGAPLAPHLGALADYYAASPKWGVWMDPRSSDDVEAAKQAGLVLDSNPMLMAAELRQTEDPDGSIEVDHVPSLDVGAVNDAAYGMPSGEVGAALGTIPDDQVHAYGTRVDGRIASVLFIQDVDDDAFVTMVATLPEHRGKRLASNVLAHALKEARQRARKTTTLQASKLGQSVYARLGYRPLGEVHLYEKRPA